MAILADTMARPLCSLVAAFALCAGAFSAAGQDERDRLEPLLTRYHADAMVPLRLHLRARAPATVGRLTCRIAQGDATLATMEIPDHYLPDRPSTIALVLPPFAEYWIPTRPVELVWTFTPEGGEAAALVHAELGVVPFVYRPPSSTHFGLDVTVLGLRTPLSRSDQDDWLRLRRLVRKVAAGPDSPIVPDDDEEGRELGTRDATVRVRPHLDLANADDLPAVASAYGAIDILVLAGPGAATLRSDQLTAIERWVRTGGVLAVVAHPDHGGQPIEGLLARCAAARGADGSESPTPLAAPLDTRLWTTDLGRVALFADDAELAGTQALEFLVLARRPRPTDTDPRTTPQHYNPAVDDGRDRDDLAAIARSLGSGTGRSEASAAAQIALVTSFLACVAIGVGVCLRRRHRRLVWPALFALALLATLGARAVASWSYAEIASSRRVAFEVVSSSGERLRRWELTCEFPTTRELRDEPADGPVTVLDPARAPFGPIVAPDPSVVLVGSPSIVHSVRLERRPWAPLAVHRTSLAAGTLEPGVDWEAILAVPLVAILDYGLTEERLLEARARIRRALPPRGVLVAVSYREILQVEPWTWGTARPDATRSLPHEDPELVRRLANHVRRLRQAPRGGAPAPRTAAATTVTPDLEVVALLALWSDAKGVVAQCRLTDWYRLSRRQSGR